MAGYAYVKEWKKRNPAKVAAYARRYRRKHPDKVAAVKARYRAANIVDIRLADAERQRERRRNDPVAQKERNRRYAERQESLKTQIAGRPRAHQCEICAASVRTVFDHCHTTGKFRGWICDRCNKILGLVNDSTTHLLALANYLARANEAQSKDAQRSA